jgi:hypothetical protein
MFPSPSPAARRSRSTFDVGAVEKSNHAGAHGWDADGKIAVGPIGLNHSVDALRPAGGAWMGVRDVAKYALLELSKGTLPNGKRLVSESALLARRAPQVTVGEHVTYGMGLEVDREWGVPVVHHGGSLFGYKSDWMILPEQGIGAVILTSSEEGYYLLRPFFRRVVEVALDAKEEALEDLTMRASAAKAEVLKERERLVLPADEAESKKLAARYTSEALGDIVVSRKGKDLVFDFGELSSPMASRKNDDGTTTFRTVLPVLMGVDFVVAERGGKRALVLRDAQHEYVLTEK